MFDRVLNAPLKATNSWLNPLDQVPVSWIIDHKPSRDQAIESSFNFICQWESPVSVLEKKIRSWFVLWQSSLWKYSFWSRDCEVPITYVKLPLKQCRSDETFSVVRRKKFSSQRFSEESLQEQKFWKKK